MLSDRDGTLVVDVSYHGGPALVRPLPTARAGLDRLRIADAATAVVSQSGVASGRVPRGQVDAAFARVAELLGDLGPPTPQTRRDEVAATPEVRGDLLQAVELLLAAEPGPAARPAARPGGA